MVAIDIEESHPENAALVELPSLRVLSGPVALEQPEVKARADGKLVNAVAVNIAGSDAPAAPHSERIRERADADELVVHGFLINSDKAGVYRHIPPPKERNQLRMPIAVHVIGSSVLAVLDFIGIVAERAYASILVIAGAFVDQKVAGGVPTDQFGLSVRVEIANRECAHDVLDAHASGERNLDILIITLVLVDIDSDTSIAADDYLYSTVAVKVTELRIACIAGGLNLPDQSGRKGVG
jgi:hypothetical protein